ncbi:MAG: DUF401 family protein [Desulfovibrionaceae bacterium]
MDLANGILDGLTRILPLLKIGAGFAGMLVCIRLRLSLGLAVLAGAGLMGLLFGMGPAGLLDCLVAGLTNEKALYLGFMVALILIMSDVLERTGQTRRLMDSLGTRMRNRRLRLVFFPALIGLLPMPGGAVFSCPMVAGMAEPMHLSPLRRVVLNYWFRHVWEMAWPLYPGLLLTASLSGVPLMHLVAFTLPGVALTLLLGWIFFLRPGVLPLPPEPAADQDAPPPPKAPWSRIVLDGLPFELAILGAIGLEMAQTLWFPRLPFELAVSAALALATLVALGQNRVGPAAIGRILMRRGLWTMVLVVASVFVFQAVLLRTGAIEQLSRLAGGDLALFTSAILLPWLAGMVSGISVAYVGASFPLLLGLIHQMGLESQLLPLLALGIFSGFTGVMASPLHVCFVLTCQYFHVDLGRAWRAVVLPCACIFCAGVAYHFLLRAF